MRCGPVRFIVLVLVLMFGPPALAQADELHWVVGTWEGNQGRGTWSDWTKFVFVQEGEKIKWTMERKSDRTSTFYEAAGTVVKSTDDLVQMEGKYTGGTYASRWAAGVLRFSLARSGGTLSGSAQGADGSVWNVSLSRSK